MAGSESGIMTVGDLIDALSNFPADAVVLIDNPKTVVESYFLQLKDTMTAPTIVAQGSATKLFEQNGGQGIYIGGEPWSNSSLQIDATPVWAVYIGIGNGIIENKWEKA